MKTPLYTALKAGVPLVSNRVYATIAPQKATVPYIVYTQVSGAREYTHDGFANVERPRVQIACYATTAAGAQAIADQVVTTMEAWTVPQAVFMDGSVDGYEAEVSLFHVMVDFLIWHA